MDVEEQNDESRRDLKAFQCNLGIPGILSSAAEITSVKRNLNGLQIDLTSLAKWCVTRTKSNHRLIEIQI